MGGGRRCLSREERGCRGSGSPCRRISPRMHTAACTPQFSPPIFATALANVGTDPRRVKGVTGVPLNSGVERGADSSGRKRPARRNSSPRRVRTFTRSAVIMSGCWVKAHALFVPRCSFASLSLATSSVRNEIPSRVLRSIPQSLAAFPQRSPSQGMLSSGKSNCMQGGRCWPSSMEPSPGLPVASDDEHKLRLHLNG